MISKKDYIQEAAYFIWLNRGNPENQDTAIWEEAEKLYELTHATFSTKKKITARKAVKRTVAKKAVIAKPAIKTIAIKKAPAKKVVAKKAIAAKPAIKKVATRKAPAKKVIKISSFAKRASAQRVEVAKIIPMIKKEDTKKAAPAKIRIVVGAKR